MKPNHFLTRLRQDIRKMRDAPERGGYLRYKKFARSKIYVLRDQMKAGQMRQLDKKRFAEAVDQFLAIVTDRQAYENE